MVFAAKEGAFPCLFGTPLSLVTKQSHVCNKVGVCCLGGAQNGFGFHKKGGTLKTRHSQWLPTRDDRGPAWKLHQRGGVAEASPN